jgi:hypothetical protein
LTVSTRETCVLKTRAKSVDGELRRTRCRCPGCGKPFKLKRVAHPTRLSLGAGLASARATDVLIFIPLIPSVVGFWLPWERWIPDTTQNKIIGPYLLGRTFAIWHFQQWWIVLRAGLRGSAVSAAAIFDMRKARVLKQARARMAHCRCLRSPHRSEPARLRKP